MYPPTFFRCSLFIWVWKWFNVRNQNFKIIYQVESLPFPNKQGTPEESRRIQQSRNLELQRPTIKMKTTVRKITNKILYTKPHLKNSDGQDFPLGFCIIFKTSIIDLTSYLPNPSAREGYDTRSIFKRSLTGLNSEISFSYTSCLTKPEELSLPYYLPIAGGRIIGFIPRVLVLC